MTNTVVPVCIASWVPSLFPVFFFFPVRIALSRCDHRHKHRDARGHRGDEHGLERLHADQNKRSSFEDAATHCLFPFPQNTLHKRSAAAAAPCAMANASATTTWSREHVPLSRVCLSTATMSLRRTARTSGVEEIDG